MKPGPTIRAALDAAAKALGDSGVAEPRREAQVLLGAALGAGREAVLGEPGRRLAAAERRAFDRLVGRRAGREPTAYILGEREFWSLSFRVTRDTLIPRPDSETLIEAALAATPERDARLRLLDLGTGSGCLLLALLSELPRATGVGVDIGAAALGVAHDNAARLGLGGRARFVRGDWGRALDGSFDLIVANPPYVGGGEAPALEPEITGFEPPVALFSGVDALACFRALAPEVARLLARRGTAVLEVGRDQADPVAAIMDRAGLAEAGRRRDLAGVERCIVLHRAGN